MESSHDERRYWDRLCCFLTDVTVHSDMSTVSIYVPPLNCTNMSGAIALAQLALFGVERVEVRSPDGYADIDYVLQGDEWIALERRVKSAHNPAVSSEPA